VPLPVIELVHTQSIGLPPLAERRLYIFDVCFEPGRDLLSYALFDSIVRDLERFGIEAYTTGLEALNGEGQRWRSYATPHHVVRNQTAGLDIEWVARKPESLELRRVPNRFSTYWKAIEPKLREALE
jgi:hypothetical protein